MCVQAAALPAFHTEAVLTLTLPALWMTEAVGTAFVLTNTINDMYESCCTNVFKHQPIRKTQHDATVPRNGSMQ
jgi:hypothetical protein